MPTNDDSKATAQSGAIKVDVGSSKQQVVGRISFGERCFGGELVFVPRQQDISALKGEHSGCSAAPVGVIQAQLAQATYASVAPLHNSACAPCCQLDQR